MAQRNNDSSSSQGAETISNAVAKAEIDKKYHEENQKNKITAPFLLPYPEPEEVQDQIVNLADLEDPPEDFELPGLTSRNPIMPNSCALVRFHFWNINPGRLQNGEVRLKAFRKLFYNQDKQHGVRTIDELCDLKRDAGPRLLKPDILRRLKISPISRHYPAYTRDTDWEEQRSRPPLAINIVPTNHTPDLRPDSGGSDSLVQEEIPPHLDTIRETLERLLIRLRYHDLEVPQTQVSSAFRRCLPPERFQLFLDANHNVDPTIDGMEYISHDRGPIGDINDGSKTKFDCILIAGKLLDAGLTRIDMEEFSSRGAQETHSHRTFVSMIKQDFASPRFSNRLRNTLHQFCQELAPTSFADLLGKVTILRRQFCYTTISLLRCENGHERPRAETKGTLACLQTEYNSEQYAGFNMQQVLQSMFQQRIEVPFQRNSRRHDVCDFNNCNMAISQVLLRYSMPLRLAVHLPSDISPRDHTSDNIRIKIVNERGEEESVVYRWLGGIYSDTELEDENTHYRVYWTGAVRGEKPTKNIRMYDPRYAEGRVIEGIAPSQRGQIPEAWWFGKFKPVLFYERVLNPSRLDVTLAAAVLGDIHHAIEHDQLILQVHEPWKPISPGLNPVQPHGPRGVEHEYREGMPSIQVGGQDGGAVIANPQPYSDAPLMSARQAQSSTYQMSQLGRFNLSDNRGYLSNGEGSSSSDYSSSMPTTIGNGNLVGNTGNTFHSSSLSNNPYDNLYGNTATRLQLGTTARGIQGIGLEFDNVLSNSCPASLPSNPSNSTVRNMAMNGETFNGYLPNTSLMTPGIQHQNSAANGYAQRTRTHNNNLSSQEQQQISWNPSHDGNAYMCLQPLASSQNYPGITASGINGMSVGATNLSQPTNGIYTGPQVSNPVEHPSVSTFPDMSQEIGLGLGLDGLNEDHPDFHTTSSHPDMELGGGTGFSFAEQENHHYETGQNGSTAPTPASTILAHPVQTSLELSMKRGLEMDTEDPSGKRIRLTGTNT